MGRVVLIPCPISGFFATIVTMPFGAMLMNGLSSAPASGPRATGWPALGVHATLSVRSSPPPAARLAVRKARRESGVGATDSPSDEERAVPSIAFRLAMSHLPRVVRRQPRRLLDGGTDAGV